MEESSTDNTEHAIGIETQKVDRGFPVVGDVRPEIDFGQPHPHAGREPLRSNVEIGKGDNREPGVAVVGIDRQCIGEVGVNNSWINRPVGKEDVTPVHAKRNDHTSYWVQSCLTVAEVRNRITPAAQLSSHDSSVGRSRGTRDGTTL